ncbi:MAG: Rieske 2Fe-2S domain-containing protein, partial [Candidatus Acidiferrum sp.]
MFERNVREVLNLYNPANPLEKAFTIPAPWYFDKRIEKLERNSVFAANWQVVGRLDQVAECGQFFTIDLNDEPLVIVRSDDGHLRAFYNVCRHHAAAVVPDKSGCAK